MLRNTSLLIMIGRTSCRLAEGAKLNAAPLAREPLSREPLPRAHSRTLQGCHARQDRRGAMSGTTSKNANKKRFGKFAAANIPVHGKAVNAGPQRGDSSFPPSNKSSANN